ncbi:MAG: hypothetical protein AB7G13_29370 [Lautropia sp.]
MDRASLRTLVLAGLFAVPTIVVASLAWQDHARAAREQAEYAAQRRAAVARLATLRDEAEQARRHADDFARLAAVGTVGRPDKLATIDRIEQALTPWRDEVVRFTLGGSRPVEVDGSNQHELRATRLDLELRPRHEASLLALLAAVRTAVPGVADVERCDLRLRGQAATDGLAAACSVSWRVFVPRSGDTAAAQEVR